MIHSDSPQSYGTLSRFFHWTMAACFGFMLVTAALFFFEVELPGLMGYHKSVGFVLMVLLVLRLLWALLNFSRRPDSGVAAKLGHAALYAFMAAVPVIALIRQYGGGRGPLEVFGVQVMQGSPEKIEWMAELGNQWHGFLAWLLFALAAGHIVMAAVHQLKGENIMARMLGRR